MGSLLRLWTRLEIIQKRSRKLFFKCERETATSKSKKVQIEAPEASEIIVKAAGAANLYHGRSLRCEGNYPRKAIRAIRMISTIILTDCRDHQGI